MKTSSGHVLLAVGYNEISRENRGQSSKVPKTGLLILPSATQNNPKMVFKFCKPTIKPNSVEVHPLTTNLILQTPSPLPWLLLFYSSFCLPLHHRLWRSLSFQHHHSPHFPHSVHHHHHHYLHYHHSSHSVHHHHHHNLFHHLPDLWFMWAWEFWPSQPVSYSF